jgi:class 3 adenylate cyclase
MTFDEILEQVIALLKRQGRVSYRAMKVRYDLNDDHLEAVKDELIYAQQVAADEDERALVWTGEAESVPSPPVSMPALTQATAQKPPPISYTPQHLTEKILTSRGALAGERKQVTICFADIKDSTELIKDLDPEAAQQLLDPAIHIMMEAVHRFEGTVNQVLGDGIMALFGAPIAHEDHAVRAFEFAHTHKERGHQAWILHLLGDITMHRDPQETNQTQTHYQQALALALANELGMRPRGLGTVYSQTGQAEQARAELSTAIEMYQDMGMTFWLPETEAGQANVEGR